MKKQINRLNIKNKNITNKKNNLLINLYNIKILLISILNRIPNWDKLSNN